MEAIKDLMTKEEFLEIANRKEAEAGAVYDVLARLVKEEKLTAADVIEYAKFRWCLHAPEAIICYYVGGKQWIVNNCDTKIPEKRAILEVNSEFGFEASRVQIIGTAYYDATDWNFIRFDCMGWAWLMENGQIHKVIW